MVASGTVVPGLGICGWAVRQSRFVTGGQWKIVFTPSPILLLLRIHFKGILRASRDYSGLPFFFLPKAYNICHCERLGPLIFSFCADDSSLNFFFDMPCIKPRPLAFPFPFLIFGFMNIVSFVLSILNTIPITFCYILSGLGGDLSGQFYFALSCILFYS